MAALEASAAHLSPSDPQCPHLLSQTQKKFDPKEKKLGIGDTVGMKIPFRESNGKPLGLSSLTCQEIE
jgi:hypothetical protein